jgi:hypothetical protein
MAGFVHEAGSRMSDPFPVSLSGPVLTLGIYPFDSALIYRRRSYVL